MFLHQHAMRQSTNTNTIFREIIQMSLWIELSTQKHRTLFLQLCPVPYSSAITCFSVLSCYSPKVGAPLYVNLLFSLFVYYFDWGTGFGAFSVRNSTSFMYYKFIYLIGFRYYYDCVMPKSKGCFGWMALRRWWIWCRYP